MSNHWTPTKPNTFYGLSSRITAKCSIIAEDRFQVDLSGYSEEAIEIFKTIPSRSYDPKSRMWSFNINNYDMLLSKLNVLVQKLTVEKLPANVLKCLKQPKNDILIDFEKIDPVLSSTLLPFQVEGVR